MAIETADVVHMANDLSKLPFATGLDEPLVQSSERGILKLGWQTHQLAHPRRACNSADIYRQLPQSTRAILPTPSHDKSPLPHIRWIT
jgi:hypothetical protein